MYSKIKPITIFVTKDKQNCKSVTNKLKDYLKKFENISDEEADKKVLGIHCPNCGSPITTLGQKSCSYCGQAILEFIGRVFTCDDIVRY